jgi:hypothetical protein
MMLLPKLSRAVAAAALCATVLVSVDAAAGWGDAAIGYASFSRGDALAQGDHISFCTGSYCSVNPWSFAQTFLYQGQSVVARSCYHHLDMQYDGNLVVYAGPGGGAPLWSTGTASAGLYTYAVIQADGNFVVYNANNSPVWASGVHGNYTAKDADTVYMQDDGNLVSVLTGDEQGIYYAGSAPTWLNWASGSAGENVGTSTCSMRSSATPTYFDTDFFGSDLRQLTIATQHQDCARACIEDASCKAFTYAKAWNTCYLKNATFANVKNATIHQSWGLVSGEVTGR